VVARLVATSQDRVREMIHRFNESGMASLDPKWAGGRPRRITTDDEALIVGTARQRPEKLGLPFKRWSVRKLAAYLNDNPGRRVRVGRERVRQLLAANDVTFQRTESWEETDDPDRDAKLDRIEEVLENHPGRTFAFDEFGPLQIRPVAGSGWAPRGRPSGSGRTIAKATECASSTAATRSATTCCGASFGSASPLPTPSQRCAPSAPASPTASRST